MALGDELRSRFTEFVSWSKGFAAAGEEYFPSAKLFAEENLATDLARIQTEAEEEERQLREGHERDRARRSAELEAAEQAMSRNAMGMALPELLRSDTPIAAATELPVALRIGHSAEGPVFLPFLGARGLHISGDDADLRNQVQVLLSRLLSAVPLSRLKVTVYDPRLTGLSGQFSELRESAPASFPPALQGEAELTRCLDEAAAQLSATAELLRIHDCADLGELWSRTRAEAPLHVLVLNGFPTAFSPEQVRRLEIFAENGPAAGVMLVVLSPTGQRGGEELRFDPAFLQGSLTAVNLDGAGAEVEVGTEVITCQAEDPPRFEDVRTLLAKVRELARSQEIPSIPFQAAIVPAEHTGLWQSSSATAMVFPIGERDNFEPLEMRLTSDNPPLPNVLLGGAVGNGKSNVLANIIYSIALRYSPWEVEMQLLDFKEGVEFRRFFPGGDGEAWLPHVSLLSLDSDREFGLSVLEATIEEIGRRAQLFKTAGVADYPSYRRAAGAAGPDTLPRRLLVIDEFQVIFDGDDEITSAAAERLMDIAKRGRSFGIHLVLSSQTLSGIRGITTKLDAIFAQFPVRISLKNTESESQVVLGQGNKAAAQLQYRGQVVLNENSGMDPEHSNVFGLAAFADYETTDRLQRHMCARFDAARAPDLFVGTEPAPWHAEDAVGASHRGDIALAVGKPVRIGEPAIYSRFAAAPSQALAVVGRGHEITDGVLGALGCAAALSSQFGHIYLLDVACLDDETTASPWARSILDTARGQGTQVTFLNGDAAAQFLATEARSLVRNRSRRDAPVLVLAGEVDSLPDAFLPWEEDEQGDDPLAKLEAELGSESAARGAEVHLEALGSEIFGGQSPAPGAATPNEGLLEIVQSGAQKRVYFAGSWSTLSLLETNLGPRRQGVRDVVLVNQGISEIRDVCGFGTEQPEGDPRFLYLDHNSGERAVTAIPFELPVLTSEVV